MTDEMQIARARLGAAARWHNPEVAHRALQDLAAARIERAIRADLDALRPEQSQALAALLTGGGNDE